MEDGKWKVDYSDCARFECDFMTRITDDIRSSIIDEVELLASAEKQLEYERKSPEVDVPVEIISVYVDDLFNLKSKPFIDSFSEQELKLLAELLGRLCVAADAIERAEYKTMAEVLKLPEWRSLMNFCKDLADNL